MTVKELKEMVANYPDEKNVVFISYAGTPWEINKKVNENPREDEKQVVIFIK